MKVTLPNGAIIETENEAELAQLLGLMGLQSPSEKESARQKTEETFGKWSVDAATRFIAQLGEGALALVKLLDTHGDLTTTQAANHLGYKDNRPIGGVIGGLRKAAEVGGWACPIETKDVDGERRLIVDVGFRAAVGRALRNSR